MRRRRKLMKVHSSKEIRQRKQAAALTLAQNKIQCRYCGKWYLFNSMLDISSIIPEIPHLVCVFCVAKIIRKFEAQFDVKKLKNIKTAKYGRKVI